MKKTFLLLLFLFFIFFDAQVDNRTITQESIDREIAFNKKISADPPKKISLFLKTNKDAKSINYKKGVIESGKQLMMFFHNIGENEKSIEYSQEVETIAKEIGDTESISMAIIQKATALSSLGFFDENYKELENAKYYVNKLTDINTKHYHMSHLYQGLAVGYYIPKKAHQDTILSYFKKSLQEAKQITDDKKNIRQTDEKYDMISYLYMNIGMYYAMIHTPKRIDIAEEYLQNSLSTINNRKFTELNVDKIPILNYLGHFYSEQNKHEIAIGYARQVIKLEKTKKSPSARVAAFATLTNSYEGLKDKDSLIKYMSLYTYLSDSLAHINKLSSDKTIKKISSKQDKEHKDNELNIILISSIIFFVLVLFGCFSWKKNQNKLHKKYKAIIDNLKNINETPLITEVIPADNSLEKSINITNETVNTILIKLNKFEKSQKFTKKNLTLTSLATELNTNTRYLSEIIKQHTGKNFNNYINGLRIQYIIEILYNEPKYREYKISYLAEVCGFASREVFATVFKKETEVTPSYFLSQLKADKVEQE